MNLKLTEEHVKFAVLGGAVLGGGGGGDISFGLKMGAEAVKTGNVILKDVHDLSEDDIVVSSSFVGAPAATNICVTPNHFIESMNILQDNYNKPFMGITSNECGGVASVNGWFQAAVKNIPFIDAPGNGRAHPTAAMGSMGLHKLRDYVSIQAAVGGSIHNRTSIAVLCRGGIENTSSMIRHASIAAGGMVAVTRNPVTIDFIKKNAAIGAITQSIEIGKAMTAAKVKNAEAVVLSVLNILGGEIICKDKITQLHMSNQGGFDIGRLEIGKYSLSISNEYMTITNSDGERLGTFPDLIMLFDTKDGYPITSATAKKNTDAFLVKIPADGLILGKGMFCMDLYEPLEKIIGEKLIAYQPN